MRNRFVELEGPYFGRYSDTIAGHPLWGKQFKSHEGKEPYRNNPVTNAIFKKITEHGAA